MANRTVSYVILPTYDAIKDILEYYGFEHVKTYIRDIPNKRMLLANNPTNITVDTSSTMLKEYIVVMKKCDNTFNMEGESLLNIIMKN